MKNIFVHVVCCVTFMLTGVRAEVLTPEILSRRLEEARTVKPEVLSPVQTLPQMLKRVLPAVVDIYAKRKVAGYSAGALIDDPVFSFFFGEEGYSRIPRERVEQSLGAGAVVGPEGYVVTNYHVVKDSDEIIVAFQDRSEHAADVVLYNEKDDVAVLKIKKADQKFPFLELTSIDQVEIGEDVVAVGNPYGLGQAVTRGIVSALAQKAIDKIFIQTDAAINRGNSGGPLVNMKGRIIGVNTAIYSQSGGSHGVGFAIPADVVRVYVDAAKQGKQPFWPWTGFMAEDVTFDIAKSLGLDKPGGVLVSKVVPLSPAEQAGLNAGDVITAVDGKSVSQIPMRFRLANAVGRDSVKISVISKGATREATLALIAPPETIARQLTLIEDKEESNHPLRGAKVANLSPAVAFELGMPLDETGVVVVDVLSGSYAIRLGLQKQDLILEINGTKIKSVKGLLELISKPSPVWKIYLRRGEKVHQVVVRG